jgi:hypothetical protein
VPTLNNAMTRTTPMMIRARMKASCFEPFTTLVIRRRAGHALAQRNRRARACFVEQRPEFQLSTEKRALAHRNSPRIAL